MLRKTIRNISAILAFIKKWRREQDVVYMRLKSKYLEWKNLDVAIKTNILAWKMMIRFIKETFLELYFLMSFYAECVIIHFMAIIYISSMNKCFREQGLKDSLQNTNTTAAFIFLFCQISNYFHFLYRYYVSRT